MPSDICAWADADDCRPRVENEEGFPCTPEIDVDTSHVNSPQQHAVKVRSPHVPRGVVVLMIIIVASFALVAVFANIQRVRRSQNEMVVVVPESSTTPEPR